MVLFGVVWCCIVLYCIVWCCMVLYGVVWCCILLQGVVWCCIVLYGVVWWCMVLHWLYGVVRTFSNRLALKPLAMFSSPPTAMSTFLLVQGLIQIALTFDLYFSHSNSTQTGLDIPPSNTVGSSYRPSLPLCKCNCKVGLLVSWFVTLLCVIILGMLLQPELGYTR